MKFVGLAYIFIIIVGGAVPGVGFQKVIPGAEEIIGSQGQITETAKTPSSLRISYWRMTCTLQYPADPEKINSCIKELQAQYKCKQEYEKGSEDYIDCVNTEIGIGIKGETEKELTATRLEFERPSEIYRTTLEKNNTQYPIPYNIITESLEKPVTASLSCRFKSENKEISGTISPDHMREIEISGPETTKRISCIPQEPYAAEDYKIIFQATIHDITTISFLDRIFIASPETEEDKDKEDDILNQRDLKRIQGSKAGEEFAAYYFEIGTQETFIYGTDEPTQTIYGSVKNLEKGEVSDVKKVEIDLRDPGISPINCMDFSIEQGNKLVWSGPGMPDLNCQLSIPDYLRDLSLEYEEPEFVPMQFKAYITYDYQIQKEDLIKIE